MVRGRRVAARSGALGMLWLVSGRLVAVSREPELEVGGGGVRTKEGWARLAIRLGKTRKKGQRWPNGLVKACPARSGLAQGSAHI